MNALTLLLVAALAACTGQAAPSASPAPAQPTLAPSTSPPPPPEPAVSQNGPPLANPAAVLAWFEGPGKAARVRIPVVLTPDPLGLPPAFLGATPGPAPANALHLKLDDTGLSVGLADRMRGDCPFDVPCAIWVEGTWGAVLSGGPSLPGFDEPGLDEPGPTPHPFRVMDYHGVVTDSATHVQVVKGG